MLLEFHHPAPPALLRAYFADLARCARPQLEGDWVLASSTSLPQRGFEPAPELAKKEWRLGPAHLRHTIEEADGNPRDGYGFVHSASLTLEGADGVQLTAGFSSSDLSAQPTRLCFTLAGFTPAQFRDARALGRARFAAEAPPTLARAASNAAELISQGARDDARALLHEVPEPWPRDDLHGLRVARRAQVALADGELALDAAQAALLRVDASDVALVEAISLKQRTLPGWTPAAAARVLAQLQPMRAELTGPLQGLASLWLEHPWWSPPGRSSLSRWRTLLHQPFMRSREGSKWVLREDGAALPTRTQIAEPAVQRALGLDSFWQRSPAANACLEGEELRLRGVVRWVRQGEGFEDLWTWCWTGEGLDGAVLVSRFAAPFDPLALGPPQGTQVCGLGDAEAVARFERALLEVDGALRLVPAG